MTLTLRQTSDARATTKGSALTYAEMDANFLHALDEGTIVVGDDSSGSTIKLGDTLKVAGGGATSTTMSGNQLTITTNVVADTTPQLGGDLDAQSNNITNLGTVNGHTIPGGSGTFALTSGVISDVVSDTSPQLGGNLDIQARTITTSTSNGDIGLVPDGNGKVDVGTGSATGTISSNGAHNLKLETI